MAQSGYTPISLYYSATATNVPSAGNLVNGELALNITDGKLYYKDNTGSVQLLAAKGGNGVTTFSGGSTGLTPNTATAGAITLGGLLAIGYGGTGVITTPTNGQLLIGNGTGYTVANLTAGSGVSISNSAGGISISATGTGGTVTSVSFTGGIISVATATTTPALTVAGTSGGIPYFSSGTTWASSAALTANALMIGGGAGAAPSTITTGTGVVTALGVNTGSAGAFVVNGGALGTPSSGTVTNLTGTASININGTVGATTANTGAFTTVSASGVITSTVATGTAPFTVASTTQVANLNAATAGNVTGIVLGANGGTGVANTGKTITIGGNLTFTGAFTTAFTVSANTSVTLPTSGTLATLAGTETLTNKRVTPRIGTTTSAATITPTSDSSDQYNVTALATSATFAIPSGTPTDGQKLSIRIKDNGTGQALTWTTTSGGYRVIGTTLPTTTTASKTIYVGCVYNAADSYWDVVAVTTQA
jgi:hypothetical protein